MAKINLEKAGVKFIMKSNKSIIKILSLKFLFRRAYEVNSFKPLLKAAHPVPNNKRALKKINNKESLALDRFIMLLVICLVFVMGCIIKGL